MSPGDQEEDDRDLAEDDDESEDDHDPSHAARDLEDHDDALPLDEHGLPDEPEPLRVRRDGRQPAGAQADPDHAITAPEGGLATPDSRSPDSHSPDTHSSRAPSRRPPPLSVFPDKPASSERLSFNAEGAADSGARPAVRTRPLLVVERLSKVFPVRRGFFDRPQFLHAVEDVSFYLRRSETLGIVGESGSGKSTLARALLRLTEPTFGRVVFDEQDISRMSLADLRPLRRRMQIVFQDPASALNPRMTVLECVAEGLSIFRMARGQAETEAMVEKALTLVGLPRETMGRFPHELSGGQKQRVGIARALAVKPELLICDEPVSALDVSIQAQILNLLLTLQRDLGLSMLFISHDLRVVAHTSHRMAVMFLGRVVEMGPSPAVCEKRYHPYTRALFDAIPKLARDHRARLPIVTDLAAETPSAVDPPRGCAYVDRCPSAEKGKCDVELPILAEVVPGSHHRVACWHPEI